ncbi:hypothetical protein ACBI99_01225 [Nonomuraea sp. ATR24]|uniref:hypothetical protein n=1 Tax=Nonomuraea sp. ATR24 TaxID=1676744 RepID=UPI0035C03ECA
MTGRIVMAAMLVVAAFVATPQAAAAAGSACTWRMQALPAPAGSTQHQVQATDHHGGYSGSAYFPDSGWHIISWKNGQVIDYGSSGHGADRVVAQNGDGTIAGLSVTGLWQASAISFRIRDGRRERLTPLPGAELNSRAFGITRNGDVYGRAVVWEGRTMTHVVVRWPYDRPGVVEEVTGLPEDMRVVGVDHDGTLLMERSSADPWPHLWRDGRLIRLSEPPDLQFGYALAISGGLVAGSLRVGSEPNRPAYWDRDGQPHLMPEGARAEQINRNGLVVSALTATPYQVWRFGTPVGELPAAASVTTVGDDDTIGGATTGPNHLPAAAVWRCS